MLWATHRRIAWQIARDLGKSREWSDVLAESSLLPDNNSYERHHCAGGNVYQIWPRVYNARQLYIQNNELGAARELGIGLHYVADDYVLISGMDDRHVDYEKEIGRVDVKDFAGQRTSLTGEQQTKQFLDNIMTELQRRQYIFKAHEALKETYRASLSIAWGVFGSKRSFELDKNLGAMAADYRRLIAKEELSFAKEVGLAGNKQDWHAAQRSQAKGLKKIPSFLKSLWYDLALEKRLDIYKKQGHLNSFLTSYGENAEKVARPYKSWYVTTPPLIMENFVRELWGAEEIAKALGMKYEHLAPHVGKEFSCYSIKDVQHVIRSEVIGMMMKK